MEKTAVKTAPASKKVNLSMKQYGMVLALIVVYLIFAALTGGKNLTAINVNNLINQRLIIQRRHKSGTNSGDIVHSGLATV